MLEIVILKKKKAFWIWGRIFYVDSFILLSYKVNTNHRWKPHFFKLCQQDEPFPFQNNGRKDSSKRFPIVIQMFIRSQTQDHNLLLIWQFCWFEKSFSWLRTPTANVTTNIFHFSFCHVLCLFICLLNLTQNLKLLLLICAVSLFLSVHYFSVNKILFA